MNKNIVLIIAALGLLFAACAGEKDAIRQVAYDYSYNAANYNIDEAEIYATEETREITLKVARRLIESVGSDYIKSDTPATIEIKAVEQTNDTMAYAVYHKVTPIKDFVDTIQLRKRDGEWYAHVVIPVVKRTAPATQEDTSKNVIRDFVPKTAEKL